MSKYRNKITYVDGIKFDSKKEANRYIELKLLEKAGEITELELQPRFDFKINGKLMFYYKADFRYKESGKEVIEDVKGMLTAVFRLKKKIIEQVYGIKILLT